MPWNRNPTDKALNTSLDISPESESTLKQIAGLRQVWRHITAHILFPGFPSYLAYQASLAQQTQIQQAASESKWIFI